MEPPTAQAQPEAVKVLDAFMVLQPGLAAFGAVEAEIRPGVFIVKTQHGGRFAAPEELIRGWKDNLRSLQENAA